MLAAAQLVLHTGGSLEKENAGPGGRELGPALPCPAGPHSISWLLRTIRATFFLKLSRDSRHSLAASMFAGDSSLGEESMLMMDSTIDSTVWTGDQRSEAAGEERKAGSIGRRTKGTLSEWKAANPKSWLTPTMLVAHGIVPRLVEDRDADLAVWVDCGA